MKLEKAITLQSYLLFAAFFALVLTGFWYSYFTRILDQENYRMHTHGVALTLWCIMLFLQAFLIRKKLNALHKIIGKFSYVLVPLIIITTIDLLRYSINKSFNGELGTSEFLFVALVINALIAFLIFYGLAIYHRKNPTIHARYMICTIFPMITPATDRIIGQHFQSLMPYLYTIEGSPIPMVAGFLLGNVILLGLCIWDWYSHKRWNVFPFALLILLTYHYSVLNFYKFDFWKTFSYWVIS